MKAYRLAAILLLGLGAIATAQDPAAQTKEVAMAAHRTQEQTEARRLQLKQVLIDLERQSWEAWQRRDGSFFQRFLSDDHVEVGFGGLTNKAKVVAGVASPACVVKSFTVDRFELAAFNDQTALLNYYAEQDTMCNGVRVPSPVWVSSLYVQRGGRWVNALYQQTQALR